MRAINKREIDSMGDISKNFNRSEFACKCGCGYDNVDAMTLEIVQSVRDHFGQSVTITSGCRCPEYNAVVGGSKNSQHVKGRAADIVVANVSPDRTSSSPNFRELRGSAR